ncbi:MAG: AIR synthase family protein [Chloroflexi bacterium]|nr:AIR synthase family protein [Chloroflexota bacterium]
MYSLLPLGKLPVELLEQLINNAPVTDDRVILGPGIGLDCAIIDMGEHYQVIKSDPITFVTGEIGWYAVQVNANDIATTGALPRWFTATVLLPEKRTTADLVLQISRQLFDACRDLGISFIGGHTEITYNLDRPIIAGTMIGEVQKDSLITPRGASAGDAVLLCKGLAIEATAILAREFPDRLLPVLGESGLQEAANYLYRPGISVLRDARTAIAAGRVTAMHDPTEGGLGAALWELAEACEHTIEVDSAAIPVSQITQKICAVFDLNPLNTISSGALLITAKSNDARQVCSALQASGSPCTIIGKVQKGPVMVWDTSGGERSLLPRPIRDDITKAYE